jgi:hypothetical protein
MSSDTSPNFFQLVFGGSISMAILWVLTMGKTAESVRFNKASKKNMQIIQLPGLIGASG